MDGQIEKIGPNLWDLLVMAWSLIKYLYLSVTKSLYQSITFYYDFECMIKRSATAVDQHLKVNDTEP